MKNTDWRLTILSIVSVCLLHACSSDSGGDSAAKTATVLVDNPPVYPSQTLPEGLLWQTNSDAPVYASPEAVKGGTYRTSALTFPVTLRLVGPDANSSFAGILRSLHMSLTSIHPNTHEIIPELATQWAYDQDGCTVYYRLDPDARWSDGRPVTADDYLFTLEFMRSKLIVAPWYNDYYTQELKDVAKYDDYTISVTGATAKPKIDLHYYYNLQPTARHFHKLDENWVTDYNWRIEPNTGAYYISRIEKGKYIEFSLKPDWWAREKRLFKHRFNVEKIRVDVIRDPDTAYRHFVKGELDSFPLLLPNFWHEKAHGELYDKGFIHKIWFYNDMPQPEAGMYLNMDYPLLQDANVRYGIAHAMNIDKMIETVLRGDYMRLHSIDAGYGEYTDNEIRAREYSLAKADDYFSKAGWGTRGPDGIRIKDGQRLSFTVTYGAVHHNDRLAFLKEEAKKAGLELNLELLDSSASYKKVIEKKHQIAWQGWTASFRPQYWEHFHSDNAHIAQTNNITNTDDAEMDTLIEQYRAETDATRHASLARSIQRKVHEIGAVIPTYMVPYTREAYWRWLKLPDPPATKWSETIFDPFGSGLFWIDEAQKQATLAAKNTDKAFEPVTIVNTRYKVY